jgi:hypothetical protein
MSSYFGVGLELMVAVLQASERLRLAFLVSFVVVWPRQLLRSGLGGYPLGAHRCLPPVASVPPRFPQREPSRWPSVSLRDILEVSLHSDDSLMP